MVKRVLFTSVLAAQFFAISAVKNINGQDKPTVAVMRADDPTPCPGCDGTAGPPLALSRADDPTPCPGCDGTAGPPLA